ncbi:alcohol dehydrogenase [uncultured archaeon]|nr:alcohol dehydrogenase [uncultured archaeon]
MKAAVLNNIKEPLEVVDLDKPEVSGNEILIKQELTGICFRDILTRDGFFPRVKTPIVPGHEISGVIVETGPDVKDFKNGDRVASLIYDPCGKCEFCLSGNENLCLNKRTYGELLNGGYAQYIKVTERSVVKVPENVTHEGAAISACVTGMVYHALHEVGGLKSGMRVLITGAGGGVGAHAIQIAKAIGAEVIAETSSAWKEEQIRNLGADHIVHSGGRFDKEIKEILGDGVHVALENVGIHTFDSSLRSLRTGGRMVVIGNVTPEPVNLPLGLIILKGNSISGSISSTRKDMQKALELTSQGKIKPIIGKKVPLERINEAYSDMLERKVFGRVYLDLSQ